MINCLLHFPNLSLVCYP